MLLALSAYRLRNTARAALHSGDYARAGALAKAAQELEHLGGPQDVHAPGQGLRDGELINGR